MADLNRPNSKGESMTNKPDNCKFCDSADIQIDGQTPTTSYIYCQNCGAEMHGTGETRVKQLAFAVERWNTKPANAKPKQIIVTDMMANNFADWFRKNYPGPNTIIRDPDWHAPRIFRVALDCVPVSVLNHAEVEQAGYKRGQKEALQEAYNAVQELSFSADNDLECAKLDGLTDASHAIEGLLDNSQEVGE